jgi:hypothetical protein
MKRYLIEYWEGDHSPLKGIHDPLVETVVASTRERALDSFWSRMFQSGGATGIVVWSVYSKV